MATSPIYGWLEPDNTDLVKNGALAIRTLGNAIDTTMGTMTPKSIVDAKGDLIAASANDTPARLAVGANGETLVADSSTSTGLRYQSGYNGNGFINGGLDVWQRGTSFANTSYAYSADRWMTFRGAFASGITTSRQSSSLAGIQYCARVARDSGNTSTQQLNFQTALETADSLRFAGQTVVVSFYARAGANYSSASSVLNTAFYTGTGTDQSTANMTGGPWTGASNTTSNVTLTTSWQRFSFTVTVGSSVSQVGFAAAYTPVGTAGANDYFEITGVKVEFGSVATNFKRAGGTIQGELAACQRYYFRITGNSGGFIALQLDAVSRGTTVNDGLIKNPVPLRIIPTAAIEYGGTQYLETHYGSGGGKTITAITLDTPTSIYNTAVQLTTGTAFTAAARLIWYFANSTTAYIGVSAEL